MPGGVRAPLIPAPGTGRAVFCLLEAAEESGAPLVPRDVGWTIACLLGVKKPRGYRHRENPRITPAGTVPLAYPIHYMAGGRQYFRVPGGGVWCLWYPPGAGVYCAAAAFGPLDAGERPRGGGRATALAAAYRYVAFLDANTVPKYPGERRYGYHLP